MSGDRRGRLAGTSAQESLSTARRHVGATTQLPNRRRSGRKNWKLPRTGLLANFRVARNGHKARPSASYEQDLQAFGRACMMSSCDMS